MKVLYLNPFIMCALAFFCVWVLYALRLSGLYNEFSFISIFVLFFILFYVFLGLFFELQLKKWFLWNEQIPKRRHLVNFNLFFVIFGFVIDCLPSFQIPLVSIIRGDLFSYNDFGLKTFHVFYMGYISAFAIVSFEYFLKNKRKVHLLGALLPVLVAVLIVNRGALLLIVFPMIILYLHQRAKRKGLNIKLGVFGLIFLVSGICLFGYLGDKRMISSGYEDDNVIFKIGQANEIFGDLPSGFFWVYLYASSPMANLVEQEVTDNVNKGSAIDFIYSSILPDFISKHLLSDSSLVFPYNKITPELTVATGFGKSFVILGYFGIFLLMIWMCVVIFLFGWMNRFGHIRSTCAILASVSALMIFDNMFVFSSCVMELIILTLFSRYKIGEKSLL